MRIYGSKYGSSSNQYMTKSSIGHYQENGIIKSKEVVLMPPKYSQKHNFPSRFVKDFHHTKFLKNIQIRDLNHQT